MTTALIALIESKLTARWSPEQVSGWLREGQSIDMSYETIYQHIGPNKKKWWPFIPTFTWDVKLVNQAVSIKKQAGGGIKSLISIDERPHVVDDKSRMGDWENDRVIGKGHSGALATIVERKSSFTVSTRVDDKSAKNSYKAATIALLTPFKSAVLTMTGDNGKEFAYHE